MAVYLTPTQLCEYYDKRRIRQLASDTDTAITEEAITTDPNLLSCIRSASAELDTAVQVGKRYTRQAVEDICAAADDVGATEEVKKRASVIKELVAHLAYGRLVSRRGVAATQIRDLAPMYDVALKRIDQLSGGTAILDVDVNIDAGVPTITRINRRGTSISGSIRMFPVQGSLVPYLGDYP